MLEIGDKVPDFSASTQDGEKISFQALKGKKYIIYFYPRDNTPGCTKEACSIRDNFTTFKKMKVPIFGVSKDSATSHQKFIEKFELPFPLLVDPDNEIAKAFGAFGKKSMYGKISFGTLRSTFVVGKDGKIEKIFSKVDTANHGTDLIDYLQNPKR